MRRFNKFTDEYFIEIILFLIIAGIVAVSISALSVKYF
jgi:hypothetical protein